MTVPTTKLAVAQDALLTVLQARSGLTGITISLGWPWTTPDSHSIVIDGDVPVWTVEELTTGITARSRWERFTLVVKCMALYSSNDYPTTRNLAIGYAGEVAQAVRTDPTFGGAIDDSEVAGGSVTEIKADDGRGRGVMFTLHIDCQTSLNG